MNDMTNGARLPRLNTRDGLPKAINGVDAYLKLLDEDDEASKKAKVVGVVAYKNQLCILWTYKCLARALPFNRVDEKAKETLSKLLSSQDMALIADYISRDERGEFDAVKSKFEKQFVSAF